MSRYKLAKSVVMIGMMGAGKTAVGTELAKLLGATFLDSDAEIEKAANQSVAEIFEQFGEAFFREKEAMVLTRLLDGAPSVLSTGGGAYLQAQNRQEIATHGLAVWLRADLDLLWSRVRHKDTRPLLRVPDPKKRLAGLLASREQFYRHAGLVVDADPNYSVCDMAQAVLERLILHPSGVVKKGN